MTELGYGSPGLWKGVLVVGLSAVTVGLWHMVGGIWSRRGPLLAGLRMAWASLPRFRVRWPLERVAAPRTSSAKQHYQELFDTGSDWLTAVEFDESTDPRPRGGVTVLPTDAQFCDRAILRVYNWGPQSRFYASATVRQMSGERINFLQNRMGGFGVRLFRSASSWQDAIDIGAGGDYCHVQLAECGGVREIILADAGTSKLASVEWDSDSAPAWLVLHLQIFHDTPDADREMVHSQTWMVEGGPDGRIRARPMP